MNVLQVIRRPIITEKGLAAKDERRTLCFEVHPDATKTEVKEAVQKRREDEDTGVTETVVRDETEDDTDEDDVADETTDDDDIPF